MHPSPRLRCFVALGTAALLVGGCSSSPDAKPATQPASSSAAGTKQDYLNAVNALCDDLLPKVVAATHGGSIDIPAQQYARDWPAHEALLKAFDTSLAAVPVPPDATSAANAMRDYIELANELDSARLIAATGGEAAWKREVSAEKGVESDARVVARNAAGFAPSCDAR